MAEEKKDETFSTFEDLTQQQILEDVFSEIQPISTFADNLVTDDFLFGKIGQKTLTGDIDDSDIDIDSDPNEFLLDENNDIVLDILKKDRIESSTKRQFKKPSIFKTGLPSFIDENEEKEERDYKKKKKIKKKEALVTPSETFAFKVDRAEREKILTEILKVSDQKKISNSDITGLRQQFKEVLFHVSYDINPANAIIDLERYVNEIPNPKLKEILSDDLLNLKRTVEKNKQITTLRFVDVLPNKDFEVRQIVSKDVNNMSSKFRPMMSKLDHLNNSIKNKETEVNNVLSGLKDITSLEKSFNSQLNDITNAIDDIIFKIKRSKKVISKIDEQEINFKKKVKEETIIINKLKKDIETKNSIINLSEFINKLNTMSAQIDLLKKDNIINSENKKIIKLNNIDLKQLIPEFKLLNARIINEVVSRDDRKSNLLKKNTQLNNDIKNFKNVLNQRSESKQRISNLKKKTKELLENTDFVNLKIDDNDKNFIILKKRRASLNKQHKILTKSRAKTLKRIESDFNEFSESIDLKTKDGKRLKISTRNVKGKKGWASKKDFLDNMEKQMDLLRKSIGDTTYRYLARRGTGEHRTVSDALKKIHNIDILTQLKQPYILGSYHKKLEKKSYKLIQHDDEVEIIINPKHFNDKDLYHLSQLISKQGHGELLDVNNVHLMFIKPNSEKEILGHLMKLISDSGDGIIHLFYISNSRYGGSLIFLNHDIVSKTMKRKI